MSALHRSSEFLFFLLGAGAIACVVLIKRGVAVATLQPIANSIDLPLILAGGIYAGTSLYRSMRRDKEFSFPAAFMIALPILAVFVVFAYINFFLPSVVTDSMPAGF